MAAERSPVVLMALVAVALAAGAYRAQAEAEGTREDTDTIAQRIQTGGGIMRVHCGVAAAAVGRVGGVFLGKCMSGAANASLDDAVAEVGIDGGDVGTDA